MGRLPVVGVTVLCALSVLVWATAHIVPFITAEDQQTAVKTSSPVEGYTVHVLAPHLVDGHQMGPYHHYCSAFDLLTRESNNPWPQPSAEVQPPLATSRREHGLLHVHAGRTARKRECE